MANFEYRDSGWLLMDFAFLATQGYWNFFHWNMSHTNRANLSFDSTMYPDKTSKSVYQNTHSRLRMQEPVHSGVRLYTEAT